MILGHIVGQEKLWICDPGCHDYGWFIVTRNSDDAKKMFVNSDLVMEDTVTCQHEN